MKVINAKTIPENAIHVGRGILTWDRAERVTDRYGYIYLLSRGDSTTTTTEVAPLVVQSEHVGERVTLIATVVATRKSTHIGDLFHGVFPTTPAVGAVITLGTGLLSVGSNCEGQMTVGIMPLDDGRDTMWLDIHALYRCHEQTVDLYYVPVI